MIEVEQGVDLLLKHIKTQTKIRETSILEAVGHVLAEDIYAPFSVPPFRKSAMDGYAIRSCDSQYADIHKPVKLKVKGEVMAGDENHLCEEGTALRIMTGGAIPKGYDCVIKQEDTNYGEDFVEIHKSLCSGQNCCEIGEDIKERALVIKRYTRVTSLHIGILASLGIAQILVLSPMKVGILSTGSELIKPGQPLSPAKTYNSCGYTISSFLKSMGVQVVFMEICKDEIGSMAEQMKARLGDVDLLITTGAISVGKRDIIPDVMDLLNAKSIFRCINMKPGTPVLANYYEGKIILGLSGNPFAALTNFHIFYWPILEKFMNHKEFGLKKSQVVVGEGSMKPSKLRRFVRAYEANGLVSIQTKTHHASVISNMVDCNCLIDQSPNHDIRVGDKVKIIYLKLNT